MSPGVDFPNHVQIDVSVRRGAIWGISIHNIHQGEVIYFSSVYI